jgi:O-antigen/teichoic acid export membrane protein
MDPMPDQNNSKQAAWVVVGSLSAFILSLAGSVVLSRYFDKADYGSYRQVIYLYETMLVVFSLGIPSAYSFFLPRVPKSAAKQVITMINGVLILSGLCFAATFYVGAEFMADALGNENLVEPIRYFAIVPAVMLPTMGIDGILATFRKTQWLALYSIATKALLFVCVALPVVLLHGHINDAIAGFVVASVISFVIAMFLKYLPLRYVEAGRTDLCYREIFAYALPLMMAGFWGVVIRSADAFFISHYFGPQVFADFSNGALELPFVAMIVSATSIVLAPLYSRKAFDNRPESKSEILGIWDSVLSKTVKLTYPLLVFFFCFSGEVMVSLYGDAYESAGDYFQVKLLVNFFTLITYGPLILSVGGHRFYLKVHMYGAIVLIAIQFLSVVLLNSPVVIVVISVICQIGRIIAMLWFIARYFDTRIRRLVPWGLSVKILLPSLMIGYSVKYLVESYAHYVHAAVVLVCAGIVYLLAYGVWAYIVKIDYWSIIGPSLKRI